MQVQNQNQKYHISCTLRGKIIVRMYGLHIHTFIS